MKAMKLAAAKARLSEIVSEAEHKQERTLIKKRDKPVAVVIGYEDFKKLEALEDVFETRLLEEILKKGKFISLEEAAKRLKLAV